MTPQEREAPLRVLSYGGGTQSAALALMSAMGQLPRVDHVVFADTQGELPETYLYAEYVRQVLFTEGIPFSTATAGSLEKALLSTERTGTNPTPPSHVINPDGSKGRVGAYRCSWDFKRALITRFTKQLCGGRGEWKRSTVEQWIGMSVDEIGRCKPDPECRCGHNRTRPDYKAGHPKAGEKRGHLPGVGCTDCACEAFDPWRINTWPLVDPLRYRRGDTIAWFAKNGHPVPPRSACWFCPNQGNSRWRALRDEHPELWERACALDEHIRDGAAFTARGNTPFKGQMFLHGSTIPLRQADLRSSLEREVDAGQGDLFDGVVLAMDCESGVCFT